MSLCQGRPVQALLCGNMKTSSSFAEGLQQDHKLGRSWMISARNICVAQSCTCHDNQHTCCTKQEASGAYWDDSGTATSSPAALIQAYVLYYGEDDDGLLACSSQIRQTTMILGDALGEQGVDMSSAVLPVLASEPLCWRAILKGLHCDILTLQELFGCCSHIASLAQLEVGVPGCMDSSTDSRPPAVPPTDLC